MSLYGHARFEGGGATGYSSAHRSGCLCQLLESLTVDDDEEEEEEEEAAVNSPRR